MFITQMQLLPDYFECTAKSKITSTAVHVEDIP